ncbi:hypothetical protein ACFYTQ_01290 [Nocardia sp. NPDC004068]|uniref:hypothetical protein n=1 Tax=Nocardia sp. NPDC004068 TaxID=3364303 RepID=UPI0036947FC6
MSSYDDYQRRIIAAQEQWNQERERIYGETRTFDSTFQGDFDPTVINYCEIYEGLSLEEMRKRVSEMRPDEVRALSHGWRDIGWNLMAASNAFNSSFARTVSGDGAHTGWTGEAATAATTAVNNYTTQSHDLVSAAQVIGLKLAEAHTGLEQTQALFPGITERPDVRTKTLPKDGVMKTDDYNNEEQTEEARRILRTVYGQVVVQTDKGVPVLPTPPKITDGPVVPGTDFVGPGNSGGGGGNDSGGGNGGTGGGTGNDGGPASGGGGGPEESKDQGGGTAGGGAEQGTQPASTAPSSVGSDSATPGSTTDSRGGTSTSPAGLSGPSAGGGSGGTSGGGFGRIGSGPGGRGGGSGGGTSANAPGRSVPGGPLGANGTPAAARAGIAGQQGMGIPGMGAPGAHGKKEDEREKGTPDYLITKEHGEELIGEYRKAVPPVIGGDYDSA